MTEPCRSVAQPGSALVWGTRGRGFESRRSDHFFGLLKALFEFCLKEKSHDIYFANHYFHRCFCRLERYAFGPRRLNSPF